MPVDIGYDSTGLDLEGFEKGKPGVSRGRKATGLLRQAAGLPKTMTHHIHSQDNERGQVIFLVAALFAVFGGMAAIAIDLGSYMAERRDLQNAADAIALAASQDLPNSAAAQSAATQWAANNDIDLSTMTVSIIPQSLPSEPNPKVRVEIEREHTFTFARLIGIESAPVGASAAAIRTTPAGGDGVVPLSVTIDALEGATYGELVVLKYDAQNIEQGNTSPIRIDGPGSGNCSSTDNYCRGIIEGSTNVVCAAGTDDTYCDGPSVVNTETGNKVGGTREAINARIALTDVQCDEFTEVLEDDPTTGDSSFYRISQECNPFLPGGFDSGRVLVIPVIDGLCNGSCSVTIVKFALFYLEGFETGNSCTGNQCEIIGRFVRVNQNVGLLAGTFNQDAENLFVRLVD